MSVFDPTKKTLKKIKKLKRHDIKTTLTNLKISKSTKYYEKIGSEFSSFIGLSQII